MGIKVSPENLIYSSRTAHVQSFLGSAECAPAGTHRCVQHTREMWDFLCVVCKPKVTPKLQPHGASAAFVASALVTPGGREPRHLDHGVGDEPALVKGARVPALAKGKTFETGEGNMDLVVPLLQS